jgi:hypothetical protein
MTNTELTTDVRAHLTLSFFPPLPSVWVAPALAAIDAAAAGRHTELIDITEADQMVLPARIPDAPRGAVKDGESVVATADFLVSVLKLDQFVRGEN